MGQVTDIVMGIIFRKYFSWFGGLSKIQVLVILKNHLYETMHWNEQK